MAIEMLEDWPCSYHKARGFKFEDLPLKDHLLVEGMHKLIMKLRGPACSYVYFEDLYVIIV